MSKWKTIKFGEVGEFQSGGTPKRSEAKYFNGYIPWITTVSLGKTYIDEHDAIEFITDEAVKYSATKIVAEKSLMIGVRVGVGKVSINKVEMCTSQDIVSITNINEKQFSKEYLVHCIKSFLSFFNEQKRGATIQGITSSLLKDLIIPCPPLDVQQKIAATLDVAAELIALRKRQLAELDELIKSVFYQMFGDPDENMHGWMLKPLDDVAAIASGVTKGRKLIDKALTTVPYMRVANVQAGKLMLDEIKEIDVLPSDVIKYQLMSGDLLMTEGGDPDKLGRCAIWNNEIENCIHQNHIFRVRLDKDILNPQFACELIGSHFGKRYFLKAAKQTTGIATINSTQLKRFPILLPPIEIQHQFSTIVTKIEEQKYLVQKAIDESQLLFDSLMNETFN